MQCDRLVNPFDPLTRQLKTLTAKRKKTDADLEEINRVKFAGSVYFDAKLGPHWPGVNVDRMVFDAAKLSRRGQDIKRAFMVLDDMVPLIYDGPRTVEKLYADARFVDIRSVVIRGQRVPTCRPIFRDWKVEFEAAFDPDVLNREDVVGFFGGPVRRVEHLPATLWPVRHRSRRRQGMGWRSKARGGELRL
jgi:hypothetical protein